MNMDEISKSYVVVRRNGEVVSFDAVKIANAISKAFLFDAEGKPNTAGKVTLSASESDKVRKITNMVVEALFSRRRDTNSIQIEDIQDQVELALMRTEEHAIARAYVLFREAQAKKRAAAVETPPAKLVLHVILADGTRAPLDLEHVRQIIAQACEGIEDVAVEPILVAAQRDLYDGVPFHQIGKALVLASRALIETEPGYDHVTARLLLDQVRAEVFGVEVSQADAGIAYQGKFRELLNIGVTAELLDKRLLQFDLEKLASALKPERDLQFGYLGLQTLYDRYFLHVGGRRFELPQTLFMRVAMGLALNEPEGTREARAIEFYEVLSKFDYMTSTPTLFNAGTRRSQLSSCYLSTVADDLDGIYSAIKDNALLSKYAGGLGNDWTPVRALGSHIKGTNGKSQGVVPFLKVVNDSAVAVNQGGKRKGAVCAYLETWHLDIEEFLELRKNVGDDRRRTHDMDTANWVPDLFMKRVMEGGEWTLFSPSDVPDLHDRYGLDFEQAYVKYEAQAEAGNINPSKKIPAVSLWRKMLSMLFETGHPWITFKDVCNIRSPQTHVGVVHSSNLCTEITLNTSADEIAVCNLGSVNLLAHLKDGKLDLDKLRITVTTAMRMLDNVIDINYYPVDKARNANLKHRPVGLGVMGFQDALYALGLTYASQQAVDFADASMEAIAYFAYLASSQLAAERGAYSTFKGSTWDRGILPHETVKLLAEQRGEYLQTGEAFDQSHLDWEVVRESIRLHGMRNSNCLAIAPTATISNIVGVTQSIEPTFQNVFVKSNLSGEFTVINEFLVKDLKKLGMWDVTMVADLKYFNGSLSKIERIPEGIRIRYKTAFEVEPQWLIECAARRQKWIDQAQSLNLYLDKPNGKKLDEIYKLAWLRGLKTTYYLRTMGASSAEKATGAGGELNAVPAKGPAATEEAPKFCGIDNPECEACQ